jgi:hypothetical protein
MAAVVYIAVVQVAAVTDTSSNSSSSKVRTYVVDSRALVTAAVQAMLL